MNELFYMNVKKCVKNIFFYLKRENTFLLYFKKIEFENS